MVVCFQMSNRKSYFFLICFCTAALPFSVDLVKPTFGSSPVNCQDFPQRPYDAGFICFT